MLPGERFKKWIDDFAMSIKDRLRGWMASWAMKGIKDFLEDSEPSAKDLMRDTLTKMIEDPNISPELKKALEDSIAKGDWAATAFGYIGMVIGSILGLMALGEAPARVQSYAVDRVVQSFRADPSLIGRIWLRDKEAWDWLWDDLRDLGYDERRLAAAQELVKIIPPLADMVRFADFSAFDPEVIAQWRQFYDAPSWISDPMSLIGITNEEPRDWANKYWFSHWIQPGRFELGEIYRRGLLGTPLLGQDEIGGPAGEGEAERLVKLAYRTMGYSEFYQEKLLQLVREVPTRVDTRRWWDMRTIDETELRELYRRRGYFGKDLENYVVWTKVYVAFPDLMARWTKGWITIDDVRRELTALGMPAERVEEMIQMKVKPQEPERVEEGKSLTKTEIYKGVKKGIITWGEGIELLMDLGYDYDEADYILTINVEALAGSPETFEAFKAITQKYKIATGREAKPMPEELKKAADEVIRLTGEVEALERSIEEEKRGLIEGEVLPEEITRRLKKLQVTKNRAISELERVKSDYNSQLAEWRHGLP